LPAEFFTQEGKAMRLITGIFLIFTSLYLKADIIYVNNVIGNDTYNGKSEKYSEGKSGPLKTIGKAFYIVKTSGRIEVAATGVPYPGGNTLWKRGGTPEKPLIINGNGAFISGLKVVSPDKWKKVDDKIFVTAFTPKSNWFIGDMSIPHWLDSPQIWWREGKPGKNLKTMAELKKTPGGFFWDKRSRKLYFHLPSGARMETEKISVPAYGTAICINTDFVVVKDFWASFSYNDGFDGHGRGKNIIFENCIGTDNCGQGFSIHDTNTVLYINCLAARNASSGCCDVNNSLVTYRDCVFVDNTFESGVYGQGFSSHILENCLIMANRPSEQIWQKSFGSMTFENCAIIGSADTTKNLLALDYGGASFNGCTFVNAPGFCNDLPVERVSLWLTDCVFSRIQRPLFTVPESHRSWLRGGGNIFSDCPGITFKNQLYGQKKWAQLSATCWFGKKNGWLNSNSEKLYSCKEAEDLGIFYTRKGKKKIGALLPKTVFQLYRRYLKQRPTASGLKSDN
jgi:hypothetical protein